MKYCLVPNSETRRKLYDETVKPGDGSDILHRWLQNSHTRNMMLRSALFNGLVNLTEIVNICSKFNYARISRTSQSSMPARFGTRGKYP
jgi:hypothetical protein